MAAKRTKRRSATQEAGEHHRRTPTFLLELPLGVNEGQAKRLRDTWKQAGSSTMPCSAKDNAD
jgi:hypothetical protein